MLLKQAWSPLANLWRLSFDQEKESPFVIAFTVSFAVPFTDLRTTPSVWFGLNKRVGEKWCTFLETTSNHF